MPTSFLLRTDENLFEALKRWAHDERRSMNAQLEFVLRRALGSEGRLTRIRPGATTPADEDVITLRASAGTK